MQQFVFRVPGAAALQIAERSALESARIAGDRPFLEETRAKRTSTKNSLDVPTRQRKSRHETLAVVMRKNDP